MIKGRETKLGDLNQFSVGAVPQSSSSAGSCAGWRGSALSQATQGSNDVDDPSGALRGR